MMEEVVTNVDENLEVDTQGGSTSNTGATASADTKELLSDDITNKANAGEEKVEPKESTKEDTTKSDEKLTKKILMRVRMSVYRSLKKEKKS